MPPSSPTLALRSLYCAAFLLTRGHKLVTFEMVDRDNGDFIFRKTRSIEADIAKFHDSGNPAQVPINEYLINFRLLRDVVMAEKRKIRQGL